MNIDDQYAVTILRLRSDSLTWRRVGEEIVMLDIAGSAYLVVNRTGAAMWNALAEGATRRQLLSLILDHFAVDAETAAIEINALLGDLAARGILVEISGT